MVRLGGLQALPLGFVVRGEALGERCGPPGGLAEELTGAELEPGIEVFGRLSEDDVGRRWGLDDVRPPSLFRLYRATVLEHYVLIPGRDPELGTGVDRREPVTPA